MNPSFNVASGICSLNAKSVVASAFAAGTESDAATEATFEVTFYRIIFLASDIAFATNLTPLPIKPPMTMSASTPTKIAFTILSIDVVQLHLRCWKLLGDTVRILSMTLYSRTSRFCKQLGYYQLSCDSVSLSTPGPI